MDQNRGRRGNWRHTDEGTKRTKTERWRTIKRNTERGRSSGGGRSKQIKRGTPKPKQGWENPSDSNARLEGIKVNVANSRTN